MTIMVGNMAAGRQYDTGAVAESFHLIYKQETETEKDRETETKNEISKA
jgi:hypothetical protein